MPTAPPWKPRCRRDCATGALEQARATDDERASIEPRETARPGGIHHTPSALAVHHVRILITTDSFPPGCGGSGWSTYELARGLRERGHELVIVLPRPGQRADRTREHDGFLVREQAAAAPDIPYVRNYFKNERLYKRLASRLREVIREERVDLVHAQHVLTSPPSISAARAEGIPVVCTVRDYWPVCYWSTLLVDPSDDTLCPKCSPKMMVKCVRPRAGAAWPLALPLIPYMTANLTLKRESLARAHAVIAVSTALARDLRARAPELARTRLEVIPNPTSLAELREAGSGEAPMAGPYALYAGKLAPNKGTMKLLTAVACADLRWPLVIVGDGPERAQLESAAARLNRPVRFTGWLAREQVLVWMRHASMLIFPSHGPESLSRVLIEAAAFGLPIAAMDTGGTRDIVTHEMSGLLSSTVEELAAHIARLATDRHLAHRLGAAARAHVEEQFAADQVVERIEALYQDLRRAFPAAAHRAISV